MRKPRERGRGRTTLAIGQLLPGVVRKATRKRRELDAIQRRWAKLVGKELARHTKPSGLRGGKLYVHADEPGASFLLSLDKPRLLANMQPPRRATRAAKPIEEIVVRPGELPG